MLITYPPPAFRIKTENDREFIWDAIRKRWILLTPEEWVRQNFVQYLIQVRKYPASLMAIEKEIRLGELKKRFDIVVFKNMRPWLIVECKEPQVAINTAVLEQVARYNMKLSGSYLVITNGRETIGWCIDKGFFHRLDALPEW